MKGLALTAASGQVFNIFPGRAMFFHSTLDSISHRSEQGNGWKGNCSTEAVGGILLNNLCLL